MVALKVNKEGQTGGDFIITFGPSDTLDTKKYVLVGMVRTCHTFLSFWSISHQLHLFGFLCSLAVLALVTLAVSLCLGLLDERFLVKIR